MDTTKANLSTEELCFLEFRQSLKEKIRKKMRKENGTDSGNKKSNDALPYNDFGSFFGPSQSVVADRVIRQCNALVKSKTMPFDSSEVSNSDNAGSNHGLKRKIQNLKYSRDYSILFSDNAVDNIPKAQPSLHESLDPKKQLKPETIKGKTKPLKQICSSKQLNKKPVKEKPAAERWKKRCYEDEDAIRMIRSMFRYNPEKYADTNDDDLRSMEVSFDDMMKEERRSARLGKREDREQLRLIEQEHERSRNKTRPLTY